MNTTIKCCLAFVSGALLGVGSSFLYFKKKHEKLLDEQVASIKEACSRSLVKEKKETSKRDDIHTYKDMVSKQYTNVKAVENKNPEPKQNPVKTQPKPFYVIEPTEYGEETGYEVASLIYYADGYLVDEYDEPVEDFRDLVGSDFAEHFGEYEDDSVYIRNDERHCDYEILKSLKTYREVLHDKPYLAGEG